MTPPLPPPSPTWQELTKFIDEQNQKARNTINFWYTLAAGIFALLLVLAGIFGWKTLGEVNTAAKAAAEQAAREVVQKRLEEPAVQKLIRDTASSLLANGTFRDAIYAKVGELISAQIKTPESRKLISDAINRELVNKLEQTTKRISNVEGVLTQVDLTSGGRKLCMTFKPATLGDLTSGNVPLYVPAKWSIQACADQAKQIGATSFRLGCIFDNHASLGKFTEITDTLIKAKPPENCGW